MVFLARNNYLSRIGALWPMPINDRLNLRLAAAFGPLPF
jgi:hypothetical protein